ncbi:MAG: hypothetical protein JWQ90_4137 [Hydrocarboniphaga sp.]|uniref:hypothetical protein n=1 Tax=Hydrocarboniphaga sp. TaxID=2033016 RepID=UPI00263131BD|nr:hypothetical protein [Hydrocarboniphaga sp.]MDB5971687.1 hypothetical protein [Hydrocarboniphaga sp.]
MLNLRRSLHCVIALCLPLALLACAHKQVEEQQQGATTQPERPAWMPPPLTSMAYSSRIGIMTVLDSEITHVTSGTAGIGNSTVASKAGFDLPGYVTQSLRKGILGNTPYQPVLVRPSARLVRDKLVWQKSWSESNQRFSDDWQKEFDAILKQNQLKLLIVISSPAEDDGIVGTAQDIVGSGYYSRSFFGKKQTAVFSTIHFYRIAGQPGKLLQPVSSPQERLYADLPNFPNPAPAPLPAPMQNSVNTAVKNMIDQKVGAFISLMK